MTGYRTPSPTIFDLLEDLEAAGRTKSAACTELGHMIRDGALTLLDFNEPAESREWLGKLAATLIDDFRMNSLSVPFLSVDYFKKVFVDRAQFEATAGIEHSQEAPAVTAVPPSGFLTNKQEALQAECVAWLKGLPPTPALPKATAKEAAKEAVKGLSGRQFDRAWDQAAPAAWKRAGRKTTAA